MLTLKSVRQLAHQLAEYGLNPSDWRLTHFGQNGEICLRHRFDKGFHLKGHAELRAARAYWNQLTLASM